MQKIMLPFFLLASLILIPGVYAKERSGEVDLRVSIDAPESSKDVRVWIPYPASDREQSIDDIRVDGNYSYKGIYREKETGNLILYAEWTRPEKQRSINFTFKASAVERIRKDFSSNGSDIPAELRDYTQGTKFIPTDGKIKDISLAITKDEKDINKKARAVYEWVVQNTKRDPNIKGCGTGDVERIIAEKTGKCADISSVFVSLARSSGIPAREVFGLRLGKNAQDDITNGHHCWAEYYSPGYGWVPLDPADVRKAMLEKNLELQDAQGYIDYYFGSVDEYRIALGRGGRGYYLNPRQKDGPLNYFMYPYAEIDGKSIEWLAGQKELKYKITFTAL